MTIEGSRSDFFEGIGYWCNGTVRFSFVKTTEKH
jgi:hypothetical protein